MGLSADAVTPFTWASIITRPKRAAVRRRAARGLSAVEAALHTRYRAELSGTVLQLGSRADGLTEVLVDHAVELVGVGYSAPEVDLCRALYGTGDFERRNLADLDAFADGHFDAIVAGRGALDGLGEEQRTQLLHRCHRLLDEDGVLIFSAQNLTRESTVRTPAADALTHPWRIFRLGRSLANRARLGAQQQRGHGFAVLNDAREAFGRLSYYVSLAHQERQLALCGLRLVECVDQRYEPVTCDLRSFDARELHFVARPQRR